ncbi:DUF3465 domain-containing protein [Acinetobacter indicus]|uniref:DUF3465 domain-containing protein n=1 Tax=Acinetobacter indicus TaxID=756892 RepID=UPI000CECABD5|nr:DUF3465 domain-containing protein [Acinetobacter indicus]
MSKKTNMGIGAVIALLVAAYLGIDLQPQNSGLNTFTEQQAETTLQAPVQDDTAKIAQAFQQRKNDVQVQATGTVVALLSDDNEGSRHQRFILELGNGQTLLVAHNIDLAPRIDRLQKGDTVEFFGEYEYTDKGGVIHWTHHDPQKRHIDGWLKHQGSIYQ